MAGRKITKEYAEAILQAFRERPGVATHAAQRAGCSVKTARRYWRNGLTRSPWPEYRIPIRDIVEKEQAIARSQMAGAQEDVARMAAERDAARMQAVREQAQKDATDTRVQEASMVRLARSSAIVLLNNLTQVAAGAASLGKKVRHSLELLGEGDEPLTMRDASNLTGMIGKLSTALRQCNDAAQKSMEMERLLLGEPGKILGIQRLDEVSVEEAKKRVEAAQRAIKRLEEKGVSQLDGRPVDPDLH